MSSWHPALLTNESNDQVRCENGDHLYVEEAIVVRSMALSAERQQVVQFVLALVAFALLYNVVRVETVPVFTVSALPPVSLVA